MVASGLKVTIVPLFSVVPICLTGYNAFPLFVFLFVNFTFTGIQLPLNGLKVH